MKSNEVKWEVRKNHNVHENPLFMCTLCKRATVCTVIGLITIVTFHLWISLHLHLPTLSGLFFLFCGQLEVSIDAALLYKPQRPLTVGAQTFTGVTWSGKWNTSRCIVETITMASNFFPNIFFFTCLRLVRHHIIKTSNQTRV